MREYKDPDVAELHPGYGTARLLRSVVARSFTMVLPGEFQAMASAYP
jgi:hypothetical protein